MIIQFIKEVAIAFAILFSFFYVGIYMIDIIDFLKDAMK